jgi:hypothetical protein
MVGTSNREVLTPVERAKSKVLQLGEPKPGGAGAVLVPILCIGVIAIAGALALRSKSPPRGKRGAGVWLTSMLGGALATAAPLVARQWLRNAVQSPRRTVVNPAPR